MNRLLGAVRATSRAHQRDRALLEVLYATGIRISEAVGPRPRRPRPRRRRGPRARQGRQGARRSRSAGPRVPQCEAYLARRSAAARASAPRAAPPTTDAVFLNARGARISRQACWTIVRRAGARVGLRGQLSPHVLRHSCATHMLDHGADLRVVQELLGHATISTTQVYTKVSPERLRAVYDARPPRARAVRESRLPGVWTGAAAGVHSPCPSPRMHRCALNSCPSVTGSTTSSRSWASTRDSFDEGFADSGQVTAERGEVEALVGTLRETLNDIDAALAKFDGGTYGICESCGGPIARGSPGGDAGGAALHQVRIEAPLSRCVTIDHVTVLWFVTLVVAVILHEISHGVVALWFGDDTARRAGRLTLNPVPHIDPFGSIILPALGALTGFPVLAWAKPVPVNPAKLRNSRAATCCSSSLAGPATNFVLMLLAAVVDPRAARTATRTCSSTTCRSSPVRVPVRDREPVPRPVQPAADPAARRLRVPRARAAGEVPARRGTASGRTGSSCCSCSCSRRTGWAASSTRSSNGCSTSSVAERARHLAHLVARFFASLVPRHRLGTRSRACMARCSTPTEFAVWEAIVAPIASSRRDVAAPPGRRRGRRAVGRGRARCTTRARARRASERSAACSRRCAARFGDPRRRSAAGPAMYLRATPSVGADVAAGGRRRGTEVVAWARHASRPRAMADLESIPAPVCEALAAADGERRSGRQAAAAVPRPSSPGRAPLRPWLRRCRRRARGAGRPRSGSATSSA